MDDVTWGGGQTSKQEVRGEGEVGGEERKTAKHNPLSLSPSPPPARSRTYTTTPEQMDWGFPVWALSLCLQGKAWVCLI